MIWDSTTVSLQRADTVFFDTIAVPEYLLYRTDTFSHDVKGDYYHRIAPRHTQGLYMEIRFRGDSMLTHNVLHGGNGHGSSCSTWGLEIPSSIPVNG